MTSGFVAGNLMFFAKRDKKKGLDIFSLFELTLMLGFINRNKLKCDCLKRQYGIAQQAMRSMNNKPYIFPAVTGHCIKTLGDGCKQCTGESDNKTEMTA